MFSLAIQSVNEFSNGVNGALVSAQVREILRGKFTKYE